MANIQKRESKKGTFSYRVRVFTGYDINGKELYKSFTWKPKDTMTEKQIEREINKRATFFEEKVQKGLILDNNIKLADYIDIWLENGKANWSPLTYERYEALTVRIKQGLGHIKLSQLQTAHIKAFENELIKVNCMKSGNRQNKEAEILDKKLSPRTIKHYHACIRAILGTATKEGIILRNVASSTYMDAPKVPKKEPKCLDDKQAQEFVRCLELEENIKVKTALTLLIFSGVRNGELCGLEWSDIDFDKHLIHIRRSSEYVTGTGLITKEPKNETSKRVISLPVPVFDQLREYKTWYMEMQLKCGDKWFRSDRLFTQNFGKPMIPYNVNKWLNKFTEKNDLPKISPHSLRHTFCTLLIANGVDIKTVSAKAGHSRTSTTLDIYTHAVKTADEEACNVLENVLLPMDKAQ